MNFIKKLDLYSKKKNHKVILIFDGGGYSYPSKESIGNVQVIFSGYKNTADELIKNYIVENKGKDLFLVTSDRELRNFALKFAIESIASRDFYNLMQGDQAFVANLTYQKSKDNLIKTSQENNDLDMLMEEASKMIVKKKEDFKSDSKSRQKNPLKASKKEKKLIRKIKKL